jgi:methionine sulfoxide reductase heme-binding subunit
MSTKRYGVLQGWPLVGIAVLAIGLCIAIILATAADSVGGLRRIIRVTARTSVALFVLAFTASALWQLWPGTWTRWLRQNRRYVGVSFAASHFIHLGAILTLGTVAPTTFTALTNPITSIFGGLAYVFIVAQALTSFDRTAQLIGPRAWKILHTTGSYYVWLIFANSYIGRAITLPEYIVPAALMVLAMTLRIAAAMARSRTPPVATANQ